MNEFELVDHWFQKGEAAAKEHYPNAIHCPVPGGTVEGKWWGRGYNSCAWYLRALEAERKLKEMQG